MGNNLGAGEAREEFRRLHNAFLRRERELIEAKYKLQESEKEKTLLVNSLKSKLDDTRQKLVASDNKVRQLKTQLHEEKLTTANGIKKLEELEQETTRLREALESEKATLEEARDKVSVLELAINATVRDLELERRRLRVARERLMLGETQLRAFYSTTEVIKTLFAKQQDQLKAMQRTVEDEVKHEKTCVDTDGVIGGTSDRSEKEVAGHHSNDAVPAPSTTDAQKLDSDQTQTSSNEASVSEKHDRDIRSAERQNPQEAETEVEEDAGGTERVLETETRTNYGEQNNDSNECGPLDGDTRQFDDDINARETEEYAQTTGREALHHSQSHTPVDAGKTAEDAEAGGRIRTVDLSTSEDAASWACSTTPSVHGDNESPRSRDNNKGNGGALDDSNILLVVESQSTPSDAAAARARQNEQQSFLLLV